jgi:hypothetical protein
VKVFFLHGGEAGALQLLPLLNMPGGRKLPEGALYDAVIRWGAAAPEPESVPVVFNRILPVLRSLKPKAAGELLAVSGVKTGGGQAEKRESDRRNDRLGDGNRPSRIPAAKDSPRGPDAWVYEFAVPVFNLEALAVWEKRRSLPGAGNLVRNDALAYREVPADGSFHARRAAKEAVRAVYALGLDYALVRLAVTASGDTLVTVVDPAPVAKTRLEELCVTRLADAMNRFADETLEVAHDAFLLGADPEFVLVGPGGKVVSASRFMERQGSVGSDAVILRGQRVILPLCELRPDPSPEPAGLVRNLRRTMKAAAERIGDASLAWRSGGMPVQGLPLGGHIHFSGVPLTGAIVRALDNYAALPLMLLEGESSRRRRPRYGRLGDVRRKRHGGFEYRPLPSWLATPELAAGVLALARVIALHWRELTRDPLQHPDTRRLFYRGEPARLVAVARSQWADLEPLPAYAEHRRELDALKEAIFGEQPLDISADFRAAWDIRLADFAGVQAPEPDRVSHPLLFY